MLFGELSVIYGTERTAEARVVAGPKDAGEPVLWTLDKTAWEEFMAMDIRHRASLADINTRKVEPYQRMLPIEKVQCTIRLDTLEAICRLGEGGFSTVTLTKDTSTGFESRVQPQGLSFLQSWLEERKILAQYYFVGPSSR